MLKVFVKRVVEIAVGCAIGVTAADALDKGVEVIKKVVEAKRNES